MKKCKICKVPLDGFLSRIPKMLFKVAPSVKNPDICNKCENKQLPADDASGDGGKYKCRICERMIDAKNALMHVKSEEYILNLIKKDHPEWRQQDPVCEECVKYYRKLVKDAEI